MIRNAAGQKWRVFAFTRATNAPVLGGAAQITAKISIDYASPVALADVNPVEAEDGYYYFDLTQAETNGNIIEIFPESSTAGVQVLGVPARELPTSSSSSGSGGSGITLGAGFPADDYLFRYLSEAGVIAFGDHDEDGAIEPFLLDDCKTFVASHVAARLTQRYAWEQIITAPIMMEVFAVGILRRVCMRRGNGVPASLEQSWQEFYGRDGLLDMIARGQMPLTDVDGLSLRPKTFNNPGWANLHVDRLYPESKVRVVSGSSDMRGTSKLSRRVDRFPENFG